MPESYVVRIYRRDRIHPDGMEGTLVAVGTEGVQMFPFHSAAELLRLLTSVAGNSETPRPAGLERRSSQNQTRRHAESVNRITECDIAHDEFSEL